MRDRAGPLAKIDEIIVEVSPATGSFPFQLVGFGGIRGPWVALSYCGVPPPRKTEPFYLRQLFSEAGFPLEGSKMTTPQAALVCWVLIGQHSFEISESLEAHMPPPALWVLTFHTKHPGRTGCESGILEISRFLFRA